MTKLEWKPEYSVGNEAIDNDHKALFALVKELDTAGPGSTSLGDIFGRLDDYVQFHFAREEALMERGGYPDLEAHKKEHQEFIDWLEVVKLTYQRASESRFMIGDSVNRFLQDWLIEHIMEEDMKYRDFIVDGNG